jgi:hypothetical protein
MEFGGMRPFRPGTAVGERKAESCPAAATHFHAHDPLLETRDDLVGTEPELNGGRTHDESKMVPFVKRPV